MSRTEELVRLKNRVAVLTTKRDRAQGRLEENKKRMKAEFGVNTLSAARKKLDELEKETAKLEEAFDTALEAFRAEWGEELDG